MDRKMCTATLIAALGYAVAMAFLFEIRDSVGGIRVLLNLVGGAMTLTALAYLCRREECNRQIRLALVLVFFSFLAEATDATLIVPVALAIAMQDGLRLLSMVLAGFGGLKWLREAAEIRTRLDDLTFRDGNTGLLNRRGFQRDAEPMLRESRDAGFRSAVIALEIDGFEKLVADHGSTFAEHVLKQFAHHIEGAFRRDDPFAYWSGAQYMIFLSRCDEQLCTLIAQRLRVYTTQHAMICDGIQIHLNAHCGIAAETAGTESLQDLTRRALVALSRARQSNRDHFFYSPNALAS